jgi:hypothetical protein
MADVLVGSAVVLAAALAIAAWMWRERVAFRERFPPISDAEFLARCRPGVDRDVALRVRRLVAEHFAIEYERVHPSMTFVEDIGAD